MKAKTTRRIDRALDRFCEAHFWLHTMEDHYHQSNAFRWSLNAFITTLTAVPELVHKAADEAKASTSEALEALKKNDLFSKLRTYRDDIVHNHGLIIDSQGTIGIYDGSKMRLGFSLPIDPSLDSDTAMLNYLRAGDPLDIMMPDEDNYPVVYRVWKSSKFDADILSVCRDALLTVSNFMHQCSQSIFTEDYGYKENQFSLACCQSLDKIQYKGYDRQELLKQLCTHYPK